MKLRPFNKKQRFYLEPGTVIIIKQILLGIFLFSLVALIITGIWYGSRVSSLTITNINVQDGQTIRGDLIKEKVEQVLEGEYIHLIPRRFSWFYPETEVLEKVQEIERIKDIRVEKKSGTELAVTFDEYQPFALWCNESNESCFFLDDKGFAFGKAPILSGESLVRYYKLGEEPQLKTNLISSDDFENTKEFSKLLANMSWFNTKIEIDAVRDVFYLLSDDSEIRATLTEKPAVTFSYLESLVRSKEFEHLKPGNFQYVDLRFGAKLYVNEEKNVAVASSTESIESVGSVENTETTTLVEPVAENIIPIATMATVTESAVASSTTE
jgi:hypothetical protein